MKLEYGLNDKPPFLKSCLMGLQWAAVLLYSAIILGKVVGALHFQEPLSQILYLQKILFICGLTIFCQIFWGHRLPLLPGPAAVLFVGMLASQGFGLNAIYTAIIIGGLFLSFLGSSGLLKYLRRFFTPNVIAVVLLLIAFTIAPTIQNLILSNESGASPLSSLGFALALVFTTLLCYRFLRGVWRSTLIIWAVIIGTLFYWLIFPDTGSPGFPADIPWVRGFFRQMTLQFALAPGLIISFIFCYIALTINDLGSIQAVNEMLQTEDVDGRIKRGIFTTGLANIAAGFMGVIGPVDYSVSPGIIAATRCASRFTLIPTAAVMFLLAFSPLVTGFIANVPSVVIGALLAYVMMTQVGAGLMVAFERKDDFRFEDGLIIGVSILTGTFVAFLPDSVFENLTPFLRPILGNGFVMGVICALLMDRLLLSRKE